ncbi:MAG: hypothetical protein GY953_39375 [bacterium]|nr:hypothetical protein [bacterium]
MQYPNIFSSDFKPLGGYQTATPFLISLTITNQTNNHSVRHNTGASASPIKFSLGDDEILSDIIFIVTSYDWRGTLNILANDERVFERDFVGNDISQTPYCDLQLQGPANVTLTANDAA